MKRVTKICLCVLLLVVVVCFVWYFSSTQWSRNFDIQYIEYVSKSDQGNLSGSSYALYEITNTTDRAFSEVTIVISVDNVVTDFIYEDSIPLGIKPGETVEYRLYTKDYQRVAEERGIELIFPSVEIVKIKYSR